MNNNY